MLNIVEFQWIIIQVYYAIKNAISNVEDPFLLIVYFLQLLVSLLDTSNCSIHEMAGSSNWQLQSVLIQK